MQSLLYTVFGCEVGILLICGRGTVKGIYHGGPRFLMSSLFTSFSLSHQSQNL
jgi:hypothetical protein